MNRDLILWASFLHDMGRVFEDSKILAGKDRPDTLKHFLMGKDLGSKWFPDLFGEDFRTLLLLSLYSHEGNIEEGTRDGEIDDTLLPYINIISRAIRLSTSHGEVKQARIAEERLISIFSRVKYGSLFTKEDYFLPLVPLSQSPDVFPQKE